jgi:hypothetical protein
MSLTRMAVTRLGKVVIHKAKRNANLSFSKGKTWHLEDMRVVEVIGVSPTPSRCAKARERECWELHRVVLSSSQSDPIGVDQRSR